jgi:SAM-dependent methyltransferase
MADSINVQTIMQEIRERLRQRSSPPPFSAIPDFSALQLPEMGALENTVRSLNSSQSLVGELPPQPISLRAKLGALLVKFVQRMLFWYTPQIREFQAGVVRGFEEQLNILRNLAAGNQQNEALLLDVKQAFEKLMQGLVAERATSEILEQALAAEIRAREHLAQSLEAGQAAEAHARERLAQSLEAGLAAAALPREHLAQSLAGEIAAREQVSADLVAEMRARESLSSAAMEKSRQLEVIIQQLRAENSYQSARISLLLEETRKRAAAVSGAPQPATLADHDNHKLDGFYCAFGDRFRGSQPEIAQRLRFYLPWLDKHQLGTSRMPILDLGCGRGEWLELLSEAGLEAYGVDTNSLFVADCRERGLRVHEADALQHLRSLPDRRLGAVTGFHIIEHLPLDVLVSLIDETVRVLKPGGLAIFETPNPQNVLVGSHNFYLDPTHRHPIPGPTAQFLLEARGLCHVEIVQLHPYAEAYWVPEDGSALARKFNEYFYGAQDYAVIGRRV